MKNNPTIPSVRLYDLSQDPGEDKNLAAEHPAVVADLTKKMNAENVASDRWFFPVKK